MAEEKEKRSWFGRLRKGLEKTRESLVSRVKDALKSGRAIDDELFESLEEALILADAGAETAIGLVEELREKVREERIRDAEAVRPFFESALASRLRGDTLAERPGGDGPLTIVMVGVNGSGKTTTLGKLAARFGAEGKRVVIGAGDTFRAAAIEQVEVWAKRANAEIVAQHTGSDPAAVAFDAVQAAKARRADVLLLDTAGRLQTKTNLMNELSKVFRVIERELGRKPDETLLVLDATTGQNALSQGRLFKDAVPVTGVVLTKLDGTAKGGIVLAVSDQLSVPVKLIGVGEGIDDLRPFDPDEFVRALFRDDEKENSGSE